jgi:O-methyltransferase
MNLLKLINPDGAIGQGLLLGRAWLHAAAFVARNPSVATLKLVRRMAKVQSRYTMLSTVRLANLHKRAYEIEDMGIPGDIVECGVWNGGSAAMMADAAPSRTLWLFDSFQGLPEPDARDGERERRMHFEGFCRGDESKVQQAFDRLGLSMDNVKIVPGWFRDTFPDAPVHSVALLHIDADWYDPVRLCLETFYDKVVPGGVIVLDDYGVWEGCKAAFDEFWERRGLVRPSLIWPDKGAVYFRKAL